MNGSAGVLDNLRVVLWVAVIVLGWICVETWRIDHAPPLYTRGTSAATSAADAGNPAAPQVPALPALPQAATGTAPATTTAAAAPAVAAAPAQGDILTVRTDVMDVEINTLGGDLQRVRLKRYPVAKDQPDVPVELLSPAADQLFLFHTGLRAAEGRPEANHLALMHAAQSAYVLADGNDELQVTLTWEAPGEVAVDKTYRFRRGRYDVGLSYRVRNLGAAPYAAASYLQVTRLHAPPEKSYFNVDSYSFTGPVAYDGDKYQKLEFDDLTEEPLSQKVAHGWIASIQHHFLAAAVPPADQVFAYDSTVRQSTYTLNAMGPLVTVAPGAETTYAATLFVGPKLQAQMDDVAQGLKLTVDYGVLTVLAQPLFWLLEKIYGVVGNWGVAIILATLLIKLAFYKLTETSGRSMARMRKLQPRLQALQERYKDNREALSQALMDMYKREKINPAAGCLPMLVQIPFFIAYYWVLLESVEMRQAPFALWITDLSTRDPYFILPLLMAGAMFLQSSLSPAPPDPLQAKIMKWMPVVFAGMFAFFPAGLVLYWLTNSVLSIAQQWNINRKLAVE
ncbi:MAG: membrane protein insertase YidC [Gammaproteobacteria bacterium]|nr:membrane protein insertase YidC [Gammaproteobacteria bacterium]